jgi:acyl-CoA synthetase (AMP-forming)/AMP-acid ligase II
MPVPAILHRAAGDPDGLALRDGECRLSWAQCADWVHRAASRLLDVAPGAGERVAVIGDNAVPTLVTHAAALAAGVGVVAVSRHLTTAEMADQFTRAAVVAVVTGAGGAAAAVEAAAQVGLRAVVVHGAPAGGATGWQAWLSAAPGEIPADRPARPPLVYTSGTTGRPAGTEVSWVKQLPATAAQYVAALAAGSTFPPGPHLVAGPLSHNGPLSCLRHLLAGGAVVVPARFDAEACLRLIAEERIASSVLVPTHFQRLLALPAQVRSAYDVSSLRQVAHTGSACPPGVKRAMIDWFGPILVESYGATEVGTVARISSTEWLAHPGSVGRVLHPFELRVLDEDGAALPAGQVGRLAFRAPVERELRYHAEPERTRAAYLAPGVFTLGDVGYVDPDGYVFITDRASDMVVSGGVNLYPAEAEAALLAHPGVAQVAVIGVPDRDFGEALHALVVPDGEAPDVAQLEHFCRARLAAYKCPKSYEFVTELSRNPMGKLDKRALRRPYWASDRTIA